MKAPIVLKPALAHIEQRLRGVTEGLMQAVERGHTSQAVAQAVRATPEWSRYQTDMARAAAESVPTHGQAPPMPEHIRDLIRRRVAAQPLAKQRLPQAGQVVRVEKMVLPNGADFDGVLLAPLHVLLDSPAQTPAIWHGWLAAGEVEYACWWDFVLQEEDAPFDPEAGMVQVWNPVHLYLPMAGPVVACLSPARLQALRALAADFATGNTGEGVAPWPGRVALRVTSDGLMVATGSPEGGVDDPRTHYQEVYFDAAEAVREPARRALRVLVDVPQDSAGDLWRRFIDTAAQWGQSLWPEPRVAVAMHATDAPALPDLLWPNLARLRLVQLDAAAGSVEIVNLGSADLQVRIMQGDLVEEHALVAPGTSAHLGWDSRSTALVLMAASGQRLQLDLH